MALLLLLLLLPTEIIKVKTQPFAKSFTVGVCTEVARKVIKQIYVKRVEVKAATAAVAAVAALPAV